MGRHGPPGWPQEVHPPGSPGFTETAIKYLLEQVPQEFRQYEVLRRHPVALACMARHHAETGSEGARETYRRAKAELATTVPPHAVDSMLAALRAEGFRFRDTARGILLVEQALRAANQPGETR